MAFETPNDSRAATGNAALVGSDYWSGRTRLGPTRVAEAPDDASVAVAPRTPDFGNGPNAAAARVAYIPSEAQDAAAGSQDTRRVAAASQPGAPCIDFHYDDQGTSADDQRINSWTPNPNSTSPLTRSWKSEHARLMQLGIDGNSYKAQFGDDLDGVVIRWMRSHNMSMDQFAAKEAEVIQRNHGHYKTLDTNRHFLGTGWKLLLGDCDNAPPAPAAIEPPRAAAPPPVPEQREAAVEPRQPVYETPDQPQPVERRSDCHFGNFPCDGGRLAVHYSSGNIIINGVRVGPGAAEVMTDGRLRYRGDGEQYWRDAGQADAGQVVPQYWPRTPEIAIGPRYPQFINPGWRRDGDGDGDWQRREAWRRHELREAEERALYNGQDYSGGGQGFYGGESPWEQRREAIRRHREWEMRQRQMAMYGQGYQNIY